MQAIFACACAVHVSMLEPGMACADTDTHTNVTKHARIKPQAIQLTDDHTVWSINDHTVMPDYPSQHSRIFAVAPNMGA